MTLLINFLSELFEIAFSPWFMAFICGCLTGLVGLILLSTFGGI